MKQSVLSRISRKLRSQSGVSWIVTVLAAACVVMSVVVVGEPLFEAIRDRMAAYGCSVAVNKAQNMINMEILQSGAGGITLERAKSILNKSKWAMDTLCPGGGECHIIPEGDTDDPDAKQRFTVVCGLHDESLQRRTRVNAEAALEKVDTELKHKRLVSADSLKSVTISLNGEDLTAVQNDEEMTRNLYYSKGYSGNVVYYDYDDDGVSLLAFGDEYYCANWRRDWGWDGSAFPDQT